MVVERVKIGRNKLEISVAFVNGDFDVATVYDGEVLGMSETRCSDIVTAGQCVQARRERLKCGVLTDQEREEIGTVLRRRAKELKVELTGLGLMDL